MGEKTEKPTAKKLREARKDGKAARSADLGSALGMIVTLGVSYLAVSMGSSHAFLWAKKSLENTIRNPNLFDAKQFTLLCIAVSLGFAMVLGAIASIVIFLTGMVQTKGIFSTKPITPDFTRLNPIEGVKKIFSLRTVITLVTIFIKVLAIYLVARSISKEIIQSLGRYPYINPYEALAAISMPIMRLVFGIAFVLLLLGGADQLVQFFMFMRDMRQDKDEVKRDYKESEGDPLIKGQRRNLAIEASFEPSRAQIQNSSVLVTNPTHVCVGLRYDPDGDAPVPIVTLKAIDKSALKTRALAASMGIPVVEYVTLARRLLAEVPIDEPIHDDLFDPVADIIAWINARKTGSNEDWLSPDRR
jgi:type III secretion protein U